MNVRLNMLLVPVLTLLLQGCLSSGGGGAEIAKPPTSGSGDNGSTTPEAPQVPANLDMVSYAQVYGTYISGYGDLTTHKHLGYSNEETLLIVYVEGYASGADSIETATGRKCEVVVESYIWAGNKGILCRFAKLPLDPVFGAVGLHEVVDGEGLFYRRNVGGQTLQKNLGTIFFANRGKLKAEPVDLAQTDGFLTPGSYSCNDDGCGKEIRITNLSAVRPSGFSAIAVPEMGTCYTDLLVKEVPGSSSTHVELAAGESCTLFMGGAHDAFGLSAIPLIIEEKDLQMQVPSFDSNVLVTHDYDSDIEGEILWSTSAERLHNFGKGYQAKPLLFKDISTF